MENKLTVKEIENAKPAAKEFKLFDGGGLLVLVSPNGGKWFRYRYRVNGRANQISCGVFPEVTLARARAARDDYRKLVKQGIDPNQERKAKKLAEVLAAGATFELVAREFLGKKKYPKGSLSPLLGRFENYVFPNIGKFPISKITPLQLLAIVQPIDDSGKNETARRVLASCGQVFRYGIATQRCTTDPTRDLRGALTTSDPSNYAAITDPKQVGPMLRMIDGYTGAFVVCIALKLAPLFFVRPGELTKAKWADFDLDAAEWRFVLSKRKRGKKARELIVPLCRQGRELVRNDKAITGASQCLFPSLRPGGKAETISDGTINAALRAMGIPKEEMCGHGFRAMARTILAQNLHFSSEIIEHQLGHAVKDPNGTAYNRTSFLPERREMMQKWADFLDGLRAGILSWL